MFRRVLLSFSLGAEVGVMRRIVMMIIRKSRAVILSNKKKAEILANRREANVLTHHQRSFVGVFRKLKFEGVEKEKGESSNGAPSPVQKRMLERAWAEI